jgi:hypothetical protein
MKTLKIILIILISIFILAIISCWLIWFVKPGKSLDVIIIDKTVKNFNRDSHSSLIWILNHDKYIDSKHKSYSLSRGYYGFYPLKPRNSGNFEIKRILLSDIAEVSDKCDILYFADMYGLYASEWYKNKVDKGPSTKIIGGITFSDYSLLKFMIDSKKTIIIESVFYCEPTEPLNRYRTEETLDIHPLGGEVGWSGKYFGSLDSTNKEIPHWIVQNYMKSNDGRWPFKHAGIVFLKGNSQSVVLEEGKHLELAIPQVETSKEISARFKVPEEVPFTNWFEIFTAGPNYRSIANFSIKVNPAGAAILDSNGIPANFAAIYLDKSEKIYFFTGDFANHDIAYSTYWIPGWLSLKQKNMFHNESTAFLWTFYYPFMSNLFNEIQKQRQAKPLKSN